MLENHVYSEIVVLIEARSKDLCILNVKVKLPKGAAGRIASQVFQKEPTDCHKLVITSIYHQIH